MANEITKINIFEEISEKLDKYLDIKDVVLENDFFEVLSDSASVLKVLKNANALIVKKRFQAFLKGFNGVDKPRDDQLRKLYEYIDNEVKAEFIADIFSKVLLSNSKLACVIMGSISQKLIENNKEISHEDLICAEAITKFFDYDIRNYKIICDYLEDYLKKKKRRKDSPKGFSLDYVFTKYCNGKEDVSFETLNLTLEKAIANQLFSKENEVDLNVDEDNLGMSSADTTEWCYITRPGEQIYNYILNLEVFNI
ncbi:hypothetical protein [Desulfosporosinus sp.]|uniref:hypothetical protein n=1 Tax=Desulfosporosinus sp. TaxID=157907 RepID=UPI00231FD08D|nr:hypothetical protein [Desulfosporosinus sp.]MDA8222487.1 hypothetical protein [Desulfitobacterium hafniense]